MKIIVAIMTYLRCCIAHMELNQCVENILKSYNESSLVYLIKEEGYSIDMPPNKAVFASNFKSKTNAKVPLRPDFYLIQISSVYNVRKLEIFLTGIYYEDNWNSDGQVLVLANNSVPTLMLFELTWKFYFRNVLIVHNNSKLYSYFPISRRNCTAYSGEYLGKCSNLSALPVVKEQTSTFIGCMIRGMDLAIPPFGMAKSSKEYPGIMQRIVITFQTLMKFDYSRTGGHKSYGSILANGTFTDFVGELRDGNIDFITGINANDTYLKYFEVLPIYLYHEYKLWAPIAKQEDVWLNPVMVFSWIMWILILISVCAVVCCSCVLAGEEKGQFRSFSYCTLFIWRTAFGDCDSLPQSIRFKSLAIIWIIATFILGSAYQCYITCVMFVPRYKEQINSIQTLLDSKLPVGGSYFPQEFLRIANTSVSRQLLENYHECSLFVECVIRAAKERDMVALKDTRSVMYIWPRLLENGEPMLFWFYDEIKLWAAIQMRKGHPLKDHMRLYLMKCLETGLLQKWDMYNRVSKIGSQCTQYNYITLDHLLLTFLLLVAGALLSLASFLYELTCIAHKIL